MVKRLPKAHRSTHSLYFSSAIRSLTGMPDRNSIMSVVKIGESIATYSTPLMTFNEIMNIPHHRTISPSFLFKKNCLKNYKNYILLREITEVVRMTAHSPEACGWNRMEWNVKWTETQAGIEQVEQKIVNSTSTTHWTFSERNAIKYWKIFQYSWAECFRFFLHRDYQIFMSFAFALSAIPLRLYELENPIFFSRLSDRSVWKKLLTADFVHFSRLFLTVCAFRLKLEFWSLSNLHLNAHHRCRTSLNWLDPVESWTFGDRHRSRWVVQQRRAMCRPSRVASSF